jgi:hypothetical protein
MPNHLIVDGIELAITFIAACLKGLADGVLTAAIRPVAFRRDGKRPWQIAVEEPLISLSSAVTDERNFADVIDRGKMTLRWRSFGSRGRKSEPGKVNIYDLSPTRPEIDHVVAIAPDRGQHMKFSAAASARIGTVSFHRQVGSPKPIIARIYPKHGQTRRLARLSYQKANVAFIAGNANALYPSARAPGEIQQRHNSTRQRRAAGNDHCQTAGRIADEHRAIGVDEGLALGELDRRQYLGERDLRGRTVVGSIATAYFLDVRFDTGCTVA